VNTNRSVSKTQSFHSLPIEKFRTVSMSAFKSLNLFNWGDRPGEIAGVGGYGLGIVVEITSIIIVKTLTDLSGCSIEICLGYGCFAFRARKLCKHGFFCEEMD
jgi:hypothetical protein